jgi:predicted ABC-type ATPase
MRRLRTPRQRLTPLERKSAQIGVLAGVNGAGKSSVAGALIRQHGGDYFNADEASRKIRDRNPSLSAADANALAWREGLQRLKTAIERGLAYDFETTLGGKTITAVLEEAARAGAEIRVWYAGLASVELHLERIRSRVSAGGHDIPESDVRRRYRDSRLNLIRLLPQLAELRLFDNSALGTPQEGTPPKPVLVLHMQRGRIVGPSDLRSTPEWAKPIVAAALKPKRARERRNRAT